MSFVPRSHSSLGLSITDSKSNDAAPSSLLSRHSLTPLPVLATQHHHGHPPLASSLVLSRLALSPTLLPSNLATLITALSLVARVSIRASALMLQAILESFKYSTSTGLGLTRRALIAAVSSARSLHYVNQKLDWNGKDASTSQPSSDVFLGVLERYTNLGIYIIHHTFTLAELFTMSGFYLTLTAVSTSFSAAESSVRMLDSILGSNETSRALSSIITLVRGELTLQDTRSFGAGGAGAASNDEAARGAIGGLAAMTKALTAFACLQTATHRRTLKELRLRVIYDCTVILEGEDETCSSTSAASKEEDAMMVAAGTSGKEEIARREEEDVVMTDVRTVESRSSSATHSRRNSVVALSKLSSTASSPISASYGHSIESDINNDDDDEGTIVLELEQLIGSSDGGALGLDGLPEEVRDALREVEQGAHRGSGVGGIRSEGFEIEIEVEETTTTTTTTVRTRESSHDVMSSSSSSAARTPSTPLFELGSLSEDDCWTEVPSNRSSRRNSGEMQMPSAMNGRMSLATLTREATIKDPEEARQRLQVVLKTMTNKFISRKRTIRRIDLTSSSSDSHSRSSSPSSKGSNARSKNRIEEVGATEAEDGGSSGNTSDRSPTPTLRSMAESNPKKSSISRALSKAKDSLRRPPTSSTTSSSSSNDNGYSRSLLFSSRSSSSQNNTSSHPSLRPLHQPSAKNNSNVTSHQSGLASPTKLPSSPSFSPTVPLPQLKRSSSMRSIRSVMTTCTTNTVVPAEEEEPKASNFPHEHLVSNLQRFMRYSSGAYGQAFLRILGIGKSDFTFPHTSTHANEHAFAAHVGILVDDILLSSYTDPSSSFSTAKMSPIINYVAVDHSVGAIVLSCRGSLGLSDILVDLLCDYETISIPYSDPKGDYKAHTGIWNAATMMQRGMVHDTIRDALESFPSYGIVLCGHSLGGGVAALLSILWSQTSSSFEDQVPYRRSIAGQRLKHPSIATPFVTSFSSGLPPGRPISCYTYGIPCVASPDLAKYCKGLVISTVHNLDVVPTLSLGVLRDLKTMAMGLYSEQGTAEEIVGRVVGLYQRKFMANRRKPSPSPTPPPPTTSNSDSSPLPQGINLDVLDDVAFSAAERESGRGVNRAGDANYVDPSLQSQELNTDADGPLNDWLWSLMKTMRAGNDNDKLFPPGVVRVIESYTVFISGDSSKTGGKAKYSRKEGRRIVLRAVDDVEARFGEPVFGRTMISDHSPLAYEASLDHLHSAVIGD